MDRRALLKALAALSVAGPAFAQPTKKMSAKDIEAMQQNWKSFVPAGAKVPSATEPLKLSKDEGKKRLPPESYKVLRDEGTERAGSSPLNAEKRAGVFVCMGCDLPVFTSEMKYESGTGWPSFFTHIPGAFEKKTDYFLIYPRTEYHCKRCGGHHGHVFDDGPPPTNQRWCNNGVSLKFLPKGAA
jgi:peptide-methionine (R)-S-oxide reductase